MATLEFVKHSRSQIVVTETVIREPLSSGSSPVAIPMLLWKDGSPWREANLWAMDRTLSGLNPKSVQSSMSGLHTYAKWLESSDLAWWHFPVREAERCLTRYRGALIDSIDRGEMASSTAAHRMRTVVRFYRWLVATSLLSPAWPMWRERSFGVRIADTFGLERSVRVQSTDLSIPNRARLGERLEGGLTPVSATDRDRIITFAADSASEELYWLLRLGFRTGMRLGTLVDLRLGTLDRAVAAPHAPGWYRIAIGPGAHPPVATKFGVTGQAWIAQEELDGLRIYATSVRRLMRQVVAAEEDQDLVLLNRFGRGYGTRGYNLSRAINMEMVRLRRAGARQIPALHNFHFHQTRATFATELARAALQHGGINDAIGLVKEALLHKDEATTLRYIRFIQRQDTMSSLADDFSRSFLGETA
ncbi:site-specific integrase [Xanthomonas arboricola]|uniref:site-specific integrase n=1 Tax=Xanthomonas arboricola TaxID=56448 RepID=UPI000C82DF81|nr:site-specific integrase [Xanthomonas arboricola]SOU05658.1 integrase/recombinase [Xanthomonas arboricola pv. fragariae]